MEGIRGLDAWLDPARMASDLVVELWISDAVDEEVSRRARQVGAPLVQIPHSLMETLSDCRSSQGVLAVIRAVEQPLRLSSGRGLYLLLDGISDPGNVGTLIRTAAAFAADGLFLFGETVDVHNPKVVRATMGALPLCPVWTVDGAIFSTLKEAEYELVPTVVRGGEDLAAFRFGPRTVLAVGHEARGISDEVLAHARRRVTIPMRGRVESLNAAVAGAICLWAACGQ